MRRLRRLLRPQSFDQLETLTAGLPVQRQEVMDKLGELQRMLGERFDAEAEATDILHRVVAELRADVAALGDQLAAGPGTGPGTEVRPRATGASAVLPGE